MSAAAALVAGATAAGQCPGRAIGAHLRHVFDKLPRVESESLPARTWRTMDESARLALVMLACSAPGDPARLVRQGWESFSHTDRLAMGSTARILAAGLAGAGCLW